MLLTAEAKQGKPTNRQDATRTASGWRLSPYGNGPARGEPLGMGADELSERFPRRVEPTFCAATRLPRRGIALTRLADARQVAPHRTSRDAVARADGEPGAASGSPIPLRCVRSYSGTATCHANHRQLAKFEQFVFTLVE